MGSHLRPFPLQRASAISNGQLPAQVVGVSVTMGGKPAYINAVTPGQINVQAPDVPSGDMQVVVETPGGSSAPFNLNAEVLGPAFFPWPDGQLVATHQDFTPAARNHLDHLRPVFGAGIEMRLNQFRTTKEAIHADYHADYHDRSLVRSWLYCWVLLVRAGRES
jgi:hypothetical protein